MFDYGTGKPQRFENMKILLENGLALDKTFIAKHDTKDFQSASYYMKLDETIERKINKLHEKKTELYEQKHEFTRLLAESDQTGIIKRIGF